MNVVPNTCALEQKQLNKITKKQEEGNQRRLNMEERSGREIKKSFYYFSTHHIIVRPFMFVYSRQKYHVPNVRHMIYDYHSLCL